MVEISSHRDLMNVVLAFLGLDQAGQMTLVQFEGMTSGSMIKDTAAEYLGSTYVVLCIAFLSLLHASTYATAPWGYSSCESER